MKGTYTEAMNKIAKDIAEIKSRLSDIDRLIADSDGPFESERESAAAVRTNVLNATRPLHILKTRTEQLAADLRSAVDLIMATHSAIIKEPFEASLDSKSIARITRMLESIRGATLTLHTAANSAHRAADFLNRASALANEIP